MSFTLPASNDRISKLPHFQIIANYQLSNCQLSNFSLLIKLFVLLSKLSADAPSKDEIPYQLPDHRLGFGYYSYYSGGRIPDHQLYL
jgi:hypothetical protein